MSLDSGIFAIAITISCVWPIPSRNLNIHSFQRNQLSAGLTEAGEIEKTLFILKYMSSETVRRKGQRENNKGESVNALARELFFGKRGELPECAIQDQLQRNSALNILINVIRVEYGLPH